MNPVAPHPDKKGSQNKKTIGSDEFEKGIPVIRDDT